MSVQVCKINRETGEIIHYGYDHHVTRLSESTAELVSENYLNTDPKVGFVVLSTGQEYTPEQILEYANSEWNVRMGYNRVLERTE